VLAQREERGALGLFLGRKFLPFGPADRAKEDRIGLLAELEGGGGERLPVAVDAGATDVGDRVLEGEVLLSGHMIEYAQRLGHDLGSDVVTGKDGELQFLHGKRIKVGKLRGRDASAVCSHDS